MEHPESRSPVATSGAASTDVDPIELEVVERRHVAVPDFLRRPTGIIGAAIVGFMIFISIFPGFVSGLIGSSDTRDCSLADSKARPRSGHPFGFDTQGCDLFNNVIHGARASLQISITVIVLVVAISVVLGCAAAYFRGWVDTVVSRLSDVILGFPIIVGLVVILQALQNRSVWNISFALVMFAWPSLTRLMRSTALPIVDLEYVRAAREMGAGPIRIIARHVLPNSFAPVAAVSVLLIASIIITEAALTVLGIGLQRPSISWGVQLNSAQGSFSSDPHLLMFPSLFLTLTVLGFVLLGEALRNDETARRSSK
ncbi:ABC transporter permease [Ilumatobacter sp.]|uniref:ABC transporter permease n=1 Tax=Ilumatobacter sp. TaxID=1967498 RepID=UPI003B521182